MCTNRPKSINRHTDKIMTSCRKILGITYLVFQKQVTMVEKEEMQMFMPRFCVVD